MNSVHYRASSALKIMGLNPLSPPNFSLHLGASWILLEFTATASHPTLASEGLQLKQVGRK